MLPKKGTYDRKFFRLLFILNKLDRGKKVSNSFLAKEFNVNIRTIQRDINLLNETGFLITPLEKGVYAFEKGFSLGKIQLSGEEASLLSFMYEIAKSLGPNLEGAFKKVLSKVLHKEHEYPYYAKVPYSLASSAKIPFIKELEDAVSENRKIDLVYKISDKKKQHCLRPLKIIFFDGFWYLLAQPDDGKVFLKFRLERIESVILLDDYFVPPENVRAILEESSNIWFSGRKTNKAILTIHSRIVDYFKQRKYFPSQKILKRNKDGSLLLEARYHDPIEVSYTIMHWIPYIVVKSPQDLKDYIKNKLIEYRKRI